MRHLLEEQLIMYYYGEAQDGNAVEEHLSTCEKCRSEFQQLKHVLATVDTLQVPERSAAYGVELWGRLQSRIRGQRFLLRPIYFRLPNFAWAAGMAGLLIFAFLLGRFWQHSAPQVSLPQISRKPAQANAAEGILLGSVADHLERSKIALTELTNTSGVREIDISGDQQWARELVAQNRLCRQSATRAGEMGVAAVLEDLELVLLDIANSPSKVSPAELSGMQKRLESQGIIFKLRILGSSLRQKQINTARELARRAS